MLQAECTIHQMDHQGLQIHLRPVKEQIHTELVLDLNPFLCWFNQVSFSLKRPDTRKKSNLKHARWSTTTTG